MTNKRMKNKSTSFFKKFLLEMPAIMLGLLLALGLNSWKENKDRENNAKILVESITEEIKENYQTLLDVKKQYSKIFRENDSVINLYKKGLIKTLRIGTVTTRLQSVAWNTANVSEDVSIIPSDVLIRIAKVYEEQERVDLIIQSLDNYYINKDPDKSGLTNAKIKQNHMSNLISRHNDLEKKYKEFLQKK